MMKRLRAWWSSRRPKPLSELLAVEFDAEGARVMVIDRLEPSWNQSFRWTDVKRVCFKDEGLFNSDTVIIELASQARPVIVLTEARGGSAFFGELTTRGLFPEQVWRKALGDTSGGTHCWPPN
jgi:hypothetical protein